MNIVLKRGSYVFLDTVATKEMKFTLIDLVQTNYGT